MKQRALTIPASLLISLLSAASLGVSADESTVAAEKEPLAAASEAVPTETPAEPVQPVTGAFGLTLGERFDPAMVTRVIDKEEKSYTGKDKQKHRGIRYRIEPKIVNEDFANYHVDTTNDGIIYAIAGENLKAGKETQCRQTARRLAAELEQQYGKARAQGGFGEWYSFRDMSQKAYRGVRLYALRCRTGYYRIEYSDDAAKAGDTATEEASSSSE